MTPTPQPSPDPPTADIGTALADIAALADTLLALHRRGLIPARPVDYFGRPADRVALKVNLALADLRYIHDIATKENPQ